MFKAHTVGMHHQPTACHFSKRMPGPALAFCCLSPHSYLFTISRGAYDQDACPIFLVKHVPYVKGRLASVPFDKAFPHPSPSVGVPSPHLDLLSIGPGPRITRVLCPFILRARMVPPVFLDVGAPRTPSWHQAPGPGG